MIKGFTTQRVFFDNRGSEPYKLGQEYHWTWNDDDQVYYRDDVDDSYYYEIPVNGKRVISLRLHKHTRLLVRIDK